MSSVKMLDALYFYTFMNEIVFLELLRYHVYTGLRKNFNIKII